MKRKITTSLSNQLSLQTTFFLNKVQSLRRVFTPLSILLLFSLFFCLDIKAQTGNALQCNGGYVTASGIDISNASFTIEFWLKHTDDGEFNTAIGQGSTADNHGLHIGLKGGNVFYFNYYYNDFTYATPTDGNWHHWACVNDGATTTRSIYQDGVLVATNNAGTNFLGTGDFYIGRASFGGGFNGTLDEVRVWSTARTQAQIQASMNSEVSSGTGLLAAYHCNQGVANGDNTSITTLTDATGNYNGTLNNFALMGTTNNFVNGLPTTYTFNGTTNADWATASNWSNNTVPTSLSSGDQVVIAANCVMSGIAISFPSGTSLTVNTGIALNLGTTSGITIASGATLTLNASASISQGFINNTGTMDIYGSYTAFYMTNNSGGVLNIKSGGSYSCPACAETMNVGSTINNDGTMHVGTGSTWQCTVNNNATGTITDGVNGAQIQLGASSIVTNAGTFVSRTAGTSGSFTNSGTLSAPATCTFTVKTGATMSNSGNLTFPSNTGLIVQTMATLTNTGTITNNGGMTVSSTGTFTNNGTYKSSGTYTGSLFTNPSGGIVAPGNSAGCMTFSNGFTNSGTVQIEVGGITACSQSDKITVTGTATLGGTLSLTYINGYTGSGNQTVNIIDATALSGTFATVSGLLANWFNNYDAPSTGKVTLSYSAVLSAELLNLKATPSVSSVKLDWETANEVNNKGFQVERRQATGDSWDILGFIAAKGKGSSYDFVDNTPLSINYYRLRQLDNDGKETLSKVVSASLKGKGGLSIYPNPVSSLLTLSVLARNEATEGSDYQILNLLGQQVLSGKTTPQIDVSALPQGTYVIKVGAEQAKFVKQ